MPGPPSRDHALRILELPATADRGSIKRAYRRLARAHHPDAGGDAQVFHELQLAYELLSSPEGAGAARRPRGRPSRGRDAWTEATEGSDARPPDLDTIDWDAALPEGERRLDRDRVGVWLAADGPGSVRRLTATSRAPGSRLNRVAHHLSGDLTSSVRVAADRDDRGREVVAVEVRGANRGARRALDQVSLEGGWVRSRGSSTTMLRWTARPGEDRRATAVRVTDSLERLLDRLSWPLTSWTLTQD